MWAIRRRILSLRTADVSRKLRTRTVTSSVVVKCTISDRISRGADHRRASSPSAYCVICPFSFDDDFFFCSSVFGLAYKKKKKKLSLRIVSSRPSENKRVDKTVTPGFEAPRLNPARVIHQSRHPRACRSTGTLVTLASGSLRRPYRGWVRRAAAYA